MRAMGSLVYYLQMYLQLFVIGFFWDRKAPADIKEALIEFTQKHRGVDMAGTFPLQSILHLHHALTALSISLDQKILVAHQPLPHPPNKT